MTIIELIERVGLENVKVQFLDESITGATATKRYTRVTFMTNEMSPGDLMQEKPRMLGIVLWLPRDKACQSPNAGDKV